MWLMLLLALVSGIYLFLSVQDKISERTSTGNNTAASPKKVDVKEITKVRIAAVGDMLPHDTVNHRAKTNSGYNYLPFLENVDQYFKSSDIRFCNQESPSAPGTGISGYPSFNAPVEFARDLNSFGCNLISLANNHLGDKGTSVISGTLDTWDKLDTLAVSGVNRTVAEQDKSVKYFDIKGIKFAFVSFTDSTNRPVPDYALNRFSDSLIKKLVRSASKKADVVIVSAHWGQEGADNPSASQKSWAKKLADNGADIVFGHGPHVLQPVEKVSNTYVWYSLGNFLSTQLKAKELIGGIAYMEIEKSGGNINIKPLGFLPTYMHYEWTKAQESAYDLLARKNLKLYLLDQAQEPMSRSLLDTTVSEQLQRVNDLLNTNTKIQIFNSKSFPD